MRIEVCVLAGSALGVGVLLGLGSQVCGAVEDKGFDTVPARTLADVALTPVGASVDEQGWGRGDVRNSTFNGYNDTQWHIGSSLIGKTDEEITSITSKTGSQSFHVSNYYTSGVVEHVISPWLSEPAGQAGTVDAGGMSPTSNTFHMSFWFKSAATSDPSPQNNGTSVFGPNFSEMSVSPDNGAGGRVGGRLDIADKATTNGYASDNVWNSGGASNGRSATGVQIGWDSGSPSEGSALSPALAYDTWYYVQVDETFVNGNNNDIVVVTVRDTSDALVWQADSTTSWITGNGGAPQTGINNWENGTSAVNSVVWRERVSADTGYGDTSGYATSRGAGFYVDDFRMWTGSGVSYYTSFELPEPGTLVLAALGGLSLLRRRR